jgi:hypothetical protein
MRQHEIEAGVNGRLPWRDAFLSARYTFEDARDDGDDPLSLPADSGLPDEWGPADGNTRHQATFFGSLNVFPTVQLGVNARAQSGPPYTITTGRDDNGDTVFNDRPAGVGRNSARGDGLFRLDLRLSWRLGIGARARRGDAAQGGGDRGGGRGGGGRDWRDEHHAMAELYVRGQNVMNAVHYIGYRGALTSPFFGRPTAARAARRLEIGARIMF